MAAVRLIPFSDADAAAVLDDRREANWATGYPTDGDIEMATHIRSGTKRTVGEDFPWSVWTVVDADTDLVVGGAGFHDPPDSTGTVEIGYGVAAECRGRGVATAAVLLLVAIAGRHGARRMVAGTDPDNLASQRVLQKSGFTRTDDADEEWRWSRDLTT